MSPIEFNSMKSIVFILVLVFAGLSVTAQNIVKNGGHENYIKMPSVVNFNDSCFRELFPVGVIPPILNPVNPDGIASANSSPDHLCNLPRTGKAHGGFFFVPKYENPEYELCFPLVKGFKYRVSTYVLLTKASDFAIDQFSFWFTNWGYLSTTGQVNVVPDYRTPANVFLTDKDNYQKIGFTFTSNGDETALVLGNIVDAAHPKGSNTLKVNGGQGQNTSYYYVDDIEVTPIPELLSSYTVCPGSPASITPLNNTACSGTLPVLWFYKSNIQQIISTEDTLNLSFTKDTVIGAIVGVDTLYTNIIISKDQYPNPLPDTSYICEGSSKVLSADLGIPGITYLWNDNSTSASISVTTTGSYSVTVSNATCSYVFETLVLATQNPDWHLPKDTFLLCGSDPVTINFNLDAAHKIISSDGQMGKTLVFSQAGAYQLKLSPTCNVNDIDSVFIIDQLALEKSIRVPNAFTPNGDGKNDLFLAMLDQVPSSYELKVINRWGKEVFSSLDPKEGWDGNLNGKPVTSDVYIYTIKSTLNACGNVQEVKKAGDVTLIR